MNPTPQIPTNVMIDIESYGLAPGSVIKSIGAVKFADGKITDRFYRRIDAQSSIAVGLKMDAATVEWWLTQSDEARREITLPGLPLSHVLLALDLWINDEDAEIWGNGAAYDNVLVACAYNTVGLPCRWAHKKSLCYRTVKNSNKHIPIDSFRVGTHHNAVDDAESQALHLMAIQQYQDGLAGAAGQLGSAVELARYMYQFLPLNKMTVEVIDHIQNEKERLEKLFPPIVS